jgi:hypothetical protein
MLMDSSEWTATVTAADLSIYGSERGQALALPGSGHCGLLTPAAPREILSPIIIKEDDMGHGVEGLVLAVSMLSLVGGMFLLMKTCKEEICCKLFYKIVAYVVVVISMLLILCSGTKIVWKYSHHAGCKHEMEMMGGKEMKPEQMREMMKNCPMMKMMHEMQEQSEEEAK